MSQVKYNFLNWNPDQEDYLNEGLITADNVVHAEEGWLDYLTPTAGSFSTSTAFNTTPSIVIRSVGTNDQRVAAWLHNATAAGAGYTVDLSVGLLSGGYTTVGTYTTVTSATTSTQYTLNRISGFDVCELGDKIFFAANAECTSATVLSGGSLVTVNLTGYADQ